ncbi:hypothetical protein C7S14_1128 [Burkholderia cepacia]|nr:hypothetical protein C7S14_1128 [Burkholderia cepacia]
MIRCAWKIDCTLPSSPPSNRRQNTPIFVVNHQVGAEK